jgi:membrane-bound lytic murein transglycosylase A
MIAQDTGGAIIGPARADIYLGAGEEAARAAGRFKHSGQFVMLVPNELDPSNVARSVPLPLPKPKDEAAKVANRATAEVAGSAAKTSQPTASQATASIRSAASVPLPKTRPAKRRTGKPDT